MSVASTSTLASSVMSLMANHHNSPTMSMQMQQHPQSGPPAPTGPAQATQYAPSRQIHQLNEAVWMQIGTFSTLLSVLAEALRSRVQFGLTLRRRELL